MFVTTLGMDIFDCTKMIAHFKKVVAREPVMEIKF